MVVGGLDHASCHLDVVQVLQPVPHDHPLDRFGLLDPPLRIAGLDFPLCGELQFDPFCCNDRIAHTRATAVVSDRRDHASRC